MGAEGRPGPLRQVVHQIDMKMERYKIEEDVSGYGVRLENDGGRYGGKPFFTLTVSNTSSSVVAQITRDDIHKLAEMFRIADSF